MGVPSSRSVTTTCVVPYLTISPEASLRSRSARTVTVGSLAASLARELIQLPEQVSVDDVAVCDHCTGRPLLRAGHDDGMDATRRENRRNGPQAIVRTAGDDAAVHHAADRERL